jgi:hypothetical protein
MLLLAPLEGVLKVLGVAATGKGWASEAPLAASVVSVDMSIAYLRGEECYAIAMEVELQLVQVSGVNIGCCCGGDEVSALQVAGGWREGVQAPLCLRVVMDGIIAGTCSLAAISFSSRQSISFCKHLPKLAFGGRL